MVTAAQDVVSAHGSPAATRERAALGAGAGMLGVSGAILAVIVLQPLHLTLFAANVLVAFWVGRQRWNWIRKYTSFCLLQTLYFCAVLYLPRPGAHANVVFRHVFPDGAYFYFLWSAVHVVLALRLFDFVMCRTERRDPAEFSLARLVLFVLYPFSFLAGPIIGFEEFYGARRGGGPRREDVLYCARKMLWGGLMLFVAAPWLHATVLDLRQSAMLGSGAAAVVDARLVMWVWLAATSVLLYIIYKGYMDVMLGASRLVGFDFVEQFWFTMFAKDPVEYWQNGNRGVYRMTTQYVFNRIFDRRRIVPKALLATAASGVAHALMCPGITLTGALLLTALFATSGLLVAVLQRAGGAPVAVMWTRVPEGTARNALVVAGVMLTFLLMAFPRASFLVLVEGRTPVEWFAFMTLLFARA